MLLLFSPVLIILLCIMIILIKMGFGPVLVALVILLITDRLMAFKNDLTNLTIDFSNIKTREKNDYQWMGKLQKGRMAIELLLWGIMSNDNNLNIACDVIKEANLIDEYK